MEYEHNFERPDRITMQSSISLLNGSFSKAAATRLKPEVLQQRDSLFAFYHRQWWCHRQMFYHFKRCHALLNGLALLVMASGMIVGPVLENSILVACLAAAGTVVKGWNDFKKFSFKVDTCHFACTTYAKTLIELQTYLRGLPFDEFEGFLVKMQTLDDTITDFTPPISDACSREYARRFQYVPVEGNCIADGRLKPPVMTISNLALQAKQDYESNV